MEPKTVLWWQLAFAIAGLIGFSIIGGWGTPVLLQDYPQWTWIVSDALLGALVSFYFTFRMNHFYVKYLRGRSNAKMRNIFGANFRDYNG